MAAIGRDAAVEASVGAVEDVRAVEAAIVVGGVPGSRGARVWVLVDDGRADASGPVVRAALDALRAGHGPAIAGSIAVARLVGGVHEPVPPRELIAAAGVTDAAAAGDELLFGARTRCTGQRP
ncbi:MAG TPA: hypothetical protein VFM87_09325 [Agrococcus sp.]|nr:hypothetical protein [Agrococcus sp.]